MILGTDIVNNAPVEFPVDALRRHIIVLGSTGSGKTVLCKAVVEEAVRSGVPVIAVDPQGDIASLALKGDPPKPDEAGGPAPTEPGFFDKARIAIFTPASTKGIPLSVNPLRLPPADTPMEDAVLAIDLTAASLSAILGFDFATPAGKGARAYLFVLMDHMFKLGRRPAGIEELIEWVQDPPAEIAEEAAGLLGSKEAEELAKKLRYLTVGTASLLFQLGMQLDIDALLDRSDGKVPLNVIYLNTLSSDGDKQFFLTTLLRELYLWMLKHPSKEVQALLYIDEVAPYIPPYPRNPPPKEAYALLFRQARKYGIGLVATTQNVTDIDYKALGQANTWCLGRLVMGQDIARVEKLVRSIDPAHADFALDRLPALKTGDFLLLSPDVEAKALEFHVRRLVSKHTTLDDRDIAGAMTAETKAFFDRYARRTASADSSKKAITVGTLRERVRDCLSSVRQAMTAKSVAARLGLPADAVSRELEREAESGNLAQGREKGGTEDLYWIPQFGFRPDAGIVAEVLTIPMNLSQADILRRARSELAGGLLGKHENITDTRFSILPLWKITARRTSKSTLHRPKEHVDDYYVNARTGTILTIDRKHVTFSKVPPVSAADLEDLDDVEEISFAPQVPGELESLPEVRITRAEAFQILHLTFGITPVAGQLALLPIWNLAIRAKEAATKRVVAMDAATGRTLEGEF